VDICDLTVSGESSVVRIVVFIDVSFFGDSAGGTPSESEDSELIMPEWVAPPLGVLPGLSLQRAVVFRTNEAMMIVHRFAAFSIGVAFDVDVYVRHGRFIGIPLMVHAPRYRDGDQFTDDLIRFGVRLADGSSWSNLDLAPADAIPSPAHLPVPPVVSCSGGSGGGHRISAQYWLWPLPPEGPLTFLAEWPASDIPESSATIDATELRVAASRSERVW
jgi:hypothetical protein